MLNLVLLGPPGCGKGTQAELLSQKFKLHKLSTGELVRAEIESASELGKEIQSTVDSGNFPNDDIIIGLIEAKVTQLVSEGKGIIFDGVPRTLNQAEKIDEMLKSVGSSISHVIELKVNEQTLIERISNRFTCVSCGAGYNHKFQKPKEDGVCDKCGSTEFKHRSDDSEEVVKQRLSVYRDQTALLVTYYDAKGLLTTVDGLQSIKKVSQEIEEILSSARPEAM